MAAHEENIDFGDDTSCEGLNALKTALESEKEGADSYREYARKTTEPTGRKMFEVLARDEEDHAAILQEQVSRLGKGLSWCTYVPRESELQMLRPNLAQVEARKHSTEGMNDLDALRIAIAQEKTSIELYRLQAQALQDEQARDMYRNLAATEETHYDFLQAQLDYIEGTGFWFGIPEFSLEEQG